MNTKDYIKYDLAGYPFNLKYPPTDGPCHGYNTYTEETLFYDFAVQGYDLKFKYQGKEYYFVTCPDYVAQCDKAFNIEYQRFTDANTAIEEFEIDGKKLITLIPDLTDVEAV